MPIHNHIMTTEELVQVLRSQAEPTEPEETPEETPEEYEERRREREQDQDIREMLENMPD